MTMSPRAIGRAALSILAVAFGLVLITAAALEFAMGPLELLLQREIAREPRTIWQNLAYVGLGIVLAFPSVRDWLWLRLQPLLPAFLAKRSGS